MDPFDVAIDHELFRISERRQPGGALSCDFTWLNGPMEGTYGFTVGRSAVGTGGITPDSVGRMTRDELIAEVRGFVAGIYEPDGSSDDWPDHVAARVRDAE
ncbi:hypothetical protein E8P82_10875 [Arthrobacter echini]|uniref:Uncharacterized protein n=1 Tax=Arthrobacter echini TaxID=1529066 RepID=A0A4S5E2Z1_9MICC|nr:hypothetical protein [Arthrobacter echini]THJ65785.1 hypothetical protein E8P82_10875 [Arthrobacter echini]